MCIILYRKKSFGKWLIVSMPETNLGILLYTLFLLYYTRAQDRVVNPTLRYYWRYKNYSLIDTLIKDPSIN